MLNKKTDFPQSQSVQNGVDNKPLTFERTFLLEDGQPDVKLFNGAYFVLDIGAAISADDFRTSTPGPDEWFVTSLGKRVFVDLAEMQRTSFIKDILYFLDVPNYQQAIFVSKENAGQTITISQCRGLASAISLFDWETLIKELKDAADSAADSAQKVSDLSTEVNAVKQSVADNAKNITDNTLALNNRQIVPAGQNWFLIASESPEGTNYYMDNDPAETETELQGTLAFGGGITAPIKFNGAAQLFLKAKNTYEPLEGEIPSPQPFSAELWINGVSAGTASTQLQPSGEFGIINISIDMVSINIEAADSEHPVPISLDIDMGADVRLMAGGLKNPSVMQWQGGGSGGNGYKGVFTTKAEAIEAAKSGVVQVGDIVQFPIEPPNFYDGTTYYAFFILLSAGEYPEYAAMFRNVWQNLNGDTHDPERNLFYSSLKTAQLLANKQDKLIDRYLYLGAGDTLVRDVSQITRGVNQLTWTSGTPVIKPKIWTTAIISAQATVPANQVIKVRIPLSANPGTYTFDLRVKLETIDINPAVISVSGINSAQLSGAYKEIEFELLTSTDFIISAGAKLKLTLETTPQGTQQKTLNILSGDLVQLSYVNFTEGGAGSGSTLEGDTVTIDAYSELNVLIPQDAAGLYAATVNGKPWLINGVLRKQGYLPAMAPYKKGDIIWLEPATYDTQTTPAKTIAASATSWLGKRHVYQDSTNFTQYAVRLRSMIDSNTFNPYDDQRYVGQYWAIDDPNAVCEQGSNTNGVYIKLAGGKCSFSKNRDFSNGAGWSFPIAVMDIQYKVTISDFIATNTDNNSGIKYIRTTTSLAFSIFEGTSRRFLVNYPSVLEASWYY